MKTMVKEKFKLIIILFENGSILYHKKKNRKIHREAKQNAINACNPGVDHFEKVSMGKIKSQYREASLVRTHGT